MKWRKIDGNESRFLGFGAQVVERMKASVLKNN